MPVLLLCQGDSTARNHLKRAIEARYGINPPVIESLKIDFRGRARAKIGPISAWVPLDASLSLRFPGQFRWEVTIKPLKLPVETRVEAFDGEFYRVQKRNHKPELVTDKTALDSVRRRLRAFSAILLTPLSDTHIMVSDSGMNDIIAEDPSIKDGVRLSMLDDFSLDYVTTRCLNPETDLIQRLRISIGDEQHPVDGLMLPHKMMVFWDDEASIEIEPTAVHMNPTFNHSTFSLLNSAFV